MVAVGLPSLNWDKFPRYKSTANVVMMVKSLPFGFLLRTKIYTTFMVFSIQCCKSTQLYCCLIWNNKFGLSDFIFYFHIKNISETVVISHFMSQLFQKSMNTNLTKCFQDCISFKYLLLNPGRYVSSDRAQVLEDEFCWLCFSSSRLARNNKALILHIILKWLVSRLGNSKKMWRKTSQFLAVVSKDIILEKWYKWNCRYNIEIFENTYIHFEKFDIMYIAQIIICLYMQSIFYCVCW